MKKLYKYQQELVDRAGESTALFWDMGLGKTITSLEIFKKFNLQRLFVLCPVSMVDEWCREFESQLGAGYHAKPYKLARKEYDKWCRINGTITFDSWLIMNNITCVVLNYDMVWRIQDYSWVNEQTMIICDESHRIKNPTSKIGKYMKFLKVKTKYKICLTGTPQSKGYIDYYNQLYFLDKIDMTLSEFKNRYCIYENAMFRGIKIKQLTGYRNVGEFERLYISQCEFLKVERVYDEIIKYHQIKLDTSKEYKRAFKNRVIYYDKDGNVVTSEGYYEYKLLDNPGAYRAGLRQLLNSKYKLAWLKDFLEDYDKRVVIFYNFNCELDSIKELIKSVRGSLDTVSVYNGSEKSFDNFKSNENGICLCNYKSGSVGINDLVVSNIFIAYSPTDNYIEWEQSKKRINRNGQVNTPIYYFLESGIESKIYHSLSIGQNFDDRVFLESMKVDV